jgi:hypothetical protein
MKDGMAPLDVEISEGNFQVLRSEIDRQMEMQSGIYDSMDNKLGVLIGFSLLALTAVAISRELIEAVSRDPSHFALFLMGISFVIGSFMVGVITYVAGRLMMGPNIEDVVDALRQDPGRDIGTAIYGRIVACLSQNQAEVEAKGIGILLMITMEALGILQILTAILTISEA